MTASEYLLFGIGNPLLDISAHVKPELLQKYNLKANDAILAADEHKPLYDELIKTYSVEYVAGGAAQNAIRGAQWLLPAHSTVYTGCVGKDAYGAQLREAAQKDGLRVEYLEDEATPTGRCAVLITDTNRSLVTDLNAANNFKETHLQKPEVWSLVENAKFYYIEGYFLTVSPASIQLIAEHGAKSGKTVSINFSAPFIPQFFSAPLDAALPYVDLVFGNESEAEAYATAHNWGTTDIKEIALRVAALPKHNSTPRRVVFTQGANQTIVAYNGEVKEYPIIKIAREQIVDTNGAGDAFAGGYLSQLVQGKGVDTSVAAGHYVANVVIQRSGPTYPREAPTFQA
ncbi:hypothetical protein HK097_003715 [Rhizophlyctis rosea]|uniref:Adenosine kinase n=1 Tax=Rhizophlyctis rosea TaxID=64517 RepID=A0AAD5SMC3_9FUNG|nr:hypothetical protein HK097_003715 [Rhizophlyctis rosea]